MQQQRPKTSIQRSNQMHRNNKEQVSNHELFDADGKHAQEYVEGGLQREWHSENDQSKLKKKEFIQLVIRFELFKMGFQSVQSKACVNKFINRFSEELEVLSDQAIMNLIRKNLSIVVEMAISKEQVLVLNEANFSQSSSSYSLKRARYEEIDGDQRLRPHQRREGIMSLQQEEVQENFLKLIPRQPKTEQEILPEILCSVCMMETTVYTYRKCGHIFCNECLRLILKENIDAGNFIVECPEWECDEQLEPIFAKKLLTPEQYTRFSHFRKKIEEENNPDNKFCSKPDCGQILQKYKDQGGLVCPRCAEKYCEICLQALHQGKCDEVMKRGINNIYKDFQIKKCPHCTAPIQKIDGCNHMACKKCKAQFCWICLRKYGPYHYRIYNCFGCPGMQFQDENELACRRVLLVVFYLMLPLAISLTIAAIVLTLPAYMVIMMIIKPYDWLEDTQMKCEVSICQNLCCCMPQCMRRLISYFFLLPRAVLYGVFIGPFKYFAGLSYLVEQVILM